MTRAIVRVFLLVLAELLVGEARADLGERVGLADARVAGRQLAERRVVRALARGQVRERLLGRGGELAVLVAPAVRLGLHEPEVTEERARRAAADALLGARDGAGEIVRVPRLARGVEEDLGGAPGVSAALVVLREDHRLDLADALEPLRGELVAERAIGLGQHRVRRLAHDRLAEHVLDLAGEPRVAAPREHLALDERVELREELGLQVGADERRDAAAPADLAEDARRAQHAPRVGVERVEPRLDHREHGLGQLALAARDGAHELLEVERVARRLADHAHDDAIVGVREHGAHELLGGLARELREAKLETGRPPGVRGNRSRSSGRAMATMNSGRCSRARSDASSSSIDGPSPQCASSSRMTSGCAAASASTNVSHARAT